MLEMGFGVGWQFCGRGFGAGGSFVGGQSRGLERGRGWERRSWEGVVG